MLDALYPAYETGLNLVTINNETKALATSALLTKMAEAAQKGAESTSTMTAVAGRASYVNAELSKGVVDPGAKAVGVWFGVVASAVL